MFKPSKSHSNDSKLLSVLEAQELIKKEASDFGFEVVKLENAYGRVLAEDVHADRNYPPFNRSAVDGFAIREQDLLEGGEFEIIEEVLAGSVPEFSVSFKKAIKIMTGAPVPLGANAVIKVEDSEISENTVRFSLKTAKLYTNISLEGEDTKQGELVLKKNQACTPLVLGTLAALGKAEVKTYKHPIVAILSTGDEIRSVNEKILSHQIRDSNSYSLLGFFNQFGITPVYKTIVADDKEKLREAIGKVSDADIVILSGGVSMGDADFVPEILQQSGIKKLFHKVEIKPGKPLWVGSKNKKVVFALPGNPFSVQVAFKVFIEPYLRKSMGLEPLKSLKLPLKGNKKKKTKFAEYFPCKISNSSLEIISFNGSGDIKAAILSDGIALHPTDKEELIEGDLIEFYFWNTL